MRLNDSAIRAAQPGQTLWDDLKGFGVRRGKISTTFIVDIGRGRRKKIGRYIPGKFGLSEAREIAKTILAEKTLGKIVPKHVAFDDAKQDFLEDCKTRLRSSTLEQYRHHLNRYSFGRKNLTDITGRDILKVLNKMTPSNKEHCFRVSRTFFTWCYNTHLIEKSPMERLVTPPNGKSRERTLSEEELRKVYKEACTFKTNAHRLTWLLIRLGQRPGETRRLQRPYFTETTLTIPSEVTKNGREHTIPITDDLYRTILDFPQVDGSLYLFPASRTHVRGKPVYYMTIGTKEWEKFQAACKVYNFTRHDLRRSVSTFWAEKLGIAPHLIERQLNHVSGEVSGVAAIYNRARYLDELRVCVERWEQYLANLLR